MQREKFYVLRLENNNANVLVTTTGKSISHPTFYSPFLPCLRMPKNDLKIDKYLWIEAVNYSFNVLSVDR